MSSNICLVCKNANGRELYPGILKCSNCGYVFADVSLSDEELFALYNEEFFSGAEFEDYSRDEDFFRKNFRLRLKELKRFIDPTRHKHLLEIGSAYGFFLDEARHDFESVEGIDITEAGVRNAREQLQLNVVQADFLDYDYGARKFDVVCMWDTIEHLRSPDLYVEKIASLTEAGALLAITTADIDSLNARVRGRRWRMIHPPTHLHYFSKQTLTRLLESRGFDVVYNRYAGFHRTIGQMAYNVLVLRQQKPGLFRMVQKMGIERLGFYLNLYDIMFVIARKQ